MRYFYQHGQIDHRYVKDLITLGINVTDPTLVDAFLHKRRYFPGVRESLGAILCENPGINNRTNAVTFAMEVKHGRSQMNISQNMIFWTKHTERIANRKEHLNFETKEWTDIPV